MYNAPNMGGGRGRAGNASMVGDSVSSNVVISVK